MRNDATNTYIYFFSRSFAAGALTTTDHGLQYGTVAQMSCPSRFVIEHPSRWCHQPPSWEQCGDNSFISSDGSRDEQENARRFRAAQNEIYCSLQHMKSYQALGMSEIISFWPTTLYIPTITRVCTGGSQVLDSKQLLLLARSPQSWLCSLKIGSNI
jgi:hypothetical protein